MRAHRVDIRSPTPLHSDVHRSNPPTPDSTLQSTPRSAGRSRVVGAIPARWGSSRLPGKPLTDLAGHPMIEHVYRRTAAAQSLERAVVLTDDERIADAVRGFGGEVEMTPADCTSGTDRIAHAARGWDGVDGVINVQGDWLIEPALIDRLARHLHEHPEDAVATLAVPARPEEMAAAAAVKVVRDRRGYALYFSRAAIPYRRDEPAGEALPGAGPLKHWGIYGYRRDALLRLADLEPTPLERTESLEQLRALENGIPIRVLTVEGQALSVDTPEDAARVSAALAAGTTDRTSPPDPAEA